jgi:hypothetical protein
MICGHQSAGYGALFHRAKHMAIKFARVIDGELLLVSSKIRFEKPRRQVQLAIDVKRKLPS